MQATAEPTAEVTSQGIAQAAGIIALSNVSSRALGLVREMVKAYLFGATGPVSAFNVAARVPTIVYDLVVGGLLTAALVPVFSDYAASERREDLRQVVSVMLSLTFVVFLSAVLLLTLLAPQVAWLLGGGFGPELRATTTTLIRVILPSLVFFGLSGVVTGLLYAQQRFTLPAIGAPLFNLGIILSAVLLAPRLDIVSLSAGVLLGAVMQLAVQLPGLRGMGLSFSLDLSHPGLRRIVRLYVPVVLGLVVSQVAVIIDRNLASRTGEQTIAWMDAATTLIQFPLGLVVTAISMAVLPSLARFDAQADLVRFRETLALGLRMVLTLILPATAGLLILGEPIVALLFQRGVFTAFDTQRTSLALSFYLIGLPCAAIDQPLIYAFYARKDTRTPVLVGVMAIGVYLVVALSLIRPWGMVGLVLANSAQWLSHAVVMLWLVHRRMGGLRGVGLGTTGMKALLSSAAMALAVQWASGWIDGAVAGHGVMAGVAVVGGGGVVGILVYLALAWVLRLGEVWLLWGTVWQRLRKS